MTSLKYMEEYVYIHLASFSIQLNLYETESQFYKKKFLLDLHTYYGECITTSKYRKDVDFSITLFEDLHIHTLSRNNVTHVELFQENVKKTITTRYSIGIINFGYILRHIISDILFTSKKGMFIHCSSVITQNKKAFIFTGESGSGKSTISSMLSDRYQLFSDDCAIIIKKHDGWYIYQVPSFEKNLYKKTSMGYKIDTIFFLYKSKTTFTHISKEKHENLSRIYSQCFLNSITPLARKFIFLQVISLLDQHKKIFHLSFNLNKKKLQYLFDQ